MSDEAVRAAERRWRATGDIRDGEAWVEAVIRGNQVPVVALARACIQTYRSLRMLATRWQPGDAVEAYGPAIDAEGLGRAVTPDDLVSFVTGGTAWMRSLPSVPVLAPASPPPAPSIEFLTTRLEIITHGRPFPPGALPVGWIGAIDYNEGTWVIVPSLIAASVQPMLPHTVEFRCDYTRRLFVETGGAYSDDTIRGEAAAGWYGQFGYLPLAPFTLRMHFSLYAIEDDGQGNLILRGMGNTPTTSVPHILWHGDGCNTPMGEESVCPRCGIPPSMQDTFLAPAPQFPRCGHCGSYSRPCCSLSVD